MRLTASKLDPLDDFDPSKMDDYNDDDDGIQDKSSHGRLRKRKANQTFIIKEEDSDDDDIEKGDQKMPRTSDESNKEKFARYSVSVFSHVHGFASYYLHGFLFQ